MIDEKTDSADLFVRRSHSETMAPYTPWLLLSIVYSVLGKLPFCRKSEHVLGYWKRLDVLLNKSFICRAQSAEEGTIFARRGGGPSVTDTIPIHDGCECDNTLDPALAKERLLYEWRPHSCALHNWDGAAFCEALGEKTMLFVGDSTMEQSAVTIMSTLSASGASCGPQLYYGRSNTYVYDIKNIDRKWFHYYEENPTDILVLAAGAWFEDSGDMYWALDSVNQTMRRWKATGMKTPRVLWKTQNPGHVMCNAFYHPISRTEEKMLNLSTDSRGWKYSWDLFPTFDSMAMNFALQEGWDIIDMSPLYLRPDAHIGKLGEYKKIGVAPNEGTGGAAHKLDCLHYCLPGPIDLFSVLLLQNLVESAAPPP